jgi:hypothetical protein
MLRRNILVLTLALGIPLAACQPTDQQAGGGAGGEQTDSLAHDTDTPGEYFQNAYTNLAEVHVSLVQGDWDEAADNMRGVRENLDGMKQTEGETLPAVVTNRINELQRSALALDQMITNRNPAAVAESRTLMNTFTRESSLAQVGLTGGGAGQTTPHPNR